MSLLEAVSNELKSEKTFTENLAVAYKTSGEELLDLNFSMTALRQKTPEEIGKMFSKAFYEDPKTAVKFLFYAGDVRGGMGERKFFRSCMEWIAENKPEIAKAVLGLIPEYTRWDNLIELISSPLDDDVVEIIYRQLVDDIRNMNNNKPVSLLGKWMPSENVSSYATKSKARLIISRLGWTSKEYRKTLSSLRKYLDVTEVKMSGKQWSEINYSTVPSRANVIYNNAFLRNDEKRRRKYLEDLASKNKDVKINASVLNPDDIVHKYVLGCRVKEYDEALEQMWKALSNIQVGDVLVVRDGSGSMLGGYHTKTVPLDVATALAIYTSEHNSGEWKDKFITFSSHPELVNFKNCKTLRDKIELTYNYSDWSNTDVYRTMKLILDAAQNAHLRQDEMPGTILIISDMQFDGRYMHYDKTLFEDIQSEYEQCGYKLPRICFWNVSGTVNKTIPIQQNDLGLILCSSYSVQTLKMMMSGELDPYKVLLEQINSDRYQPVEDAIKDLVA